MCSRSPTNEIVFTDYPFKRKVKILLIPFSIFYSQERGSRGEERLHFHSLNNPLQLYTLRLARGLKWQRQRVIPQCHACAVVDKTAACVCSNVYCHQLLRFPLKFGLTLGLELCFRLDDWLKHPRRFITRFNSSQL